MAPRKETLCEGYLQLFIANCVDDQLIVLSLFLFFLLRKNVEDTGTLDILKSVFSLYIPLEVLHSPVCTESSVASSVSAVSFGLGDLCWTRRLQ